MQQTVHRMRVVCAAKNCKYSSDNEDSRHIVFINFPNDDTCKVWAQHCGRTDLMMKSNKELHSNYYICSHHIEDHYYISKIDPVIIDEHAVPTLFEPETVTEKDTSDAFVRTEETEVTNSVVLSYFDMNVEVDQYQDVSVRFSNLCRICGETSIDGIEIFSAKGIELKLKEKVNLHLPVTVDVEDLMPQKVCLNCCNRLDVVHSLVVTSLRTDLKLRKCLNINEELNYDNRYNKLVQQCSLEIAEEICTNEGTQTTSVELSPNMEDSSVNQETAMKLDHLEHIRTMKNIENEMQSGLKSFVHPPNGENKDQRINKTAQHYTSNDATAFDKMLCVHCKDSFETRELFDDHKISCYEKETTVEKEKENNRDSENAGIIDLRDGVSKDYNTRPKNIKNAKHLIEHKVPYRTLLEEEQYKLSTVSNANNERYNANDSHDTINISLLETNKKCGHCDTICNTKKELLSHIAEHHKGQLLFKCTMCERSYEKWSSLDVHEATHRVDKPYLCDLCGKSFKHSNNLRGHKRTHLDDSKKKRHVCEMCGNAFRSRFHLGEHMNQHNGNKPYPCDKCGKTFYKRIQLRQHVLSHGLNKHVCPICGTAFNRKGNMNTHIKRHNKGNGTYTCSVCTYRCKTMSELKLHRKKHTEQDIVESIRKRCIDKTVWQCKSCNRIFSTRTALRSHERIHRREKNSIECNVCGKKLSSKNSLIYHKRSLHSTERPHMCQYCGESFVSKEARLIHERIHTGERPYVCKVCNMEYKCSSNLNQHMKIHTGVKPYKCTRCNKCFTRKGTLNVHERIHTGEKPFSCDTCGRTFSQKNDMLKHAKTHQSKSLHCEQCNGTFTRKKDILKHVTLHEQNDSMIQEYVEVQEAESYGMDIPCPQFE